MSNAGTRHSAKRPRKPWAKNSTKQGQGHSLAIALIDSPLRAITRISTASSWVNIDGT